jgi:competence ComEA-like helix-hairpin-helix protein
MTLYSRPQLTVLVALVAVAGVGLAAGHWRRANPAIVERIEGFDQAGDEISRIVPGLERRIPPDSSKTPAGSPTRPPTRSTPKTPPGPDRTPPAVIPPRLFDEVTPLDVNRASAEDLGQLPGVGPALADRIVASRDLGGPFASVDDLRRVRGLAASTIDRFRSLITVTPPQ